MSIRVNMVSESEFSVQGHGVHTAFVEITKALKKLPQTSVAVNSSQSADIVHVHTVGLFAMGRMLRDRSAKRVITAHITPESLIGSLKLAKQWSGLAHYYLKKFYNLADVVVAVSETTKQNLLKLGVTKPIVVIENFIDTAHYQQVSRQSNKTALRQELDLPIDKFIVIGAGQVQARKGIRDLITIAESRPDDYFIWVGGIPFKNLGADYNEMKKIMETPYPNLKFVGIVDLKDMVTYYVLSDAFMLASTQETFGLVVLEAAACGLPILLRDIADYDYTFKDYALLSKDAADFSQNVEALRNNPKLYKKYSKLALEVARKYDSVKIAKITLALYQQLLGGQEIELL